MIITSVDHLVPAPQDGEPGRPAVGYYMIASPAVISVDSNGNPSTKRLTVSAYKVTGDTREPYTGSVIVTVYNAAGFIANRDILDCPATLTLTAKSVSNVGYFDFLIRLGGNSVAALAVPVVRSGKDGTDGKNGTSFTVKGEAVGHAASVPDNSSSVAQGIWLIDNIDTSGAVKLGIWYSKFDRVAEVSAGDAYLIGSDIWVQSAFGWRNLGPFRGPEGAPGPPGNPGAPGPMSYLAGEWQRGITYTRTSDMMPIVSHNGCYWRPAAEGSLLNIEPSADAADWQLVSKDDIIFAKFVMSDFGKFGSAVMVGDYLISQYGRLNGETINGDSSKLNTAYTNFDASAPEDKSKFVPRLYINLRTGEIHCEIGSFRGKIEADSGVFKGRIEADEGIFKGICRQPFVLFDGYNFDASGSWSAADRYDNLALPVVNDGWSHDVSLPWSDDCIGRKLTLVNFAWRGLYSSSPYVIDAPDKKYFYENGSAVSQLTVSQEAVQLLGFGDDKGFYGWIVINRVPLGQQKMFGAPARLMFAGRVTADNKAGTAKLEQSYSSDGTALKLTRLGKGEYKITMPWYGGRGAGFMPIVTGTTAGSTTDAKHVYASVIEQTTNSFTVRTADDDTANEGGFNFIVLPTSAW